MRKKSESYIHKILCNNRIFGLLLLNIGIFFIVFIVTSNTLLVKMGITLILTGLFLMFLITEKRETSKIVEGHVIQVIVAWTLIVFIITINVNTEILSILTFLGILVIKEITDQFTSVHFKNRLNIFIFAFILLFTFIVVKRIINF